MPIYYTSPYPYQQYSGIWKLSDASQNVGQGSWGGMPRLYVAGNNGQGQLGIGTFTGFSASPILIGSTTQWKTVTSGSQASFVFGILNTGALYGWGRNSEGELGIGTTTSVGSPTQVGNLTNWLAIACGYQHTLSIKTDGTLWTWGRNTTGQLGLGNITYYSSPKQVGALTNWLKITAGVYYSVAIKTDGTLWAWGLNNYGQLGLNNRTAYSSPKQVGALTNWSSIGSTNSSTIAIKTDGTLWALGGVNTSGQLGLGNLTNYSSPKQIGSLTNWLNISCGNNFTLCTKTDGTLWCWGVNSVGQLGLQNTTNYSSPKQIGVLTTWSKIVSGNSSGYAIKTNGTLWSWGNNAQGQLALITGGNYYSSPVQVGSLTTWTAISSGVNTLYAIQPS